MLGAAAQSGYFTTNFKELLFAKSGKIDLPLYYYLHLYTLGWWNIQRPSDGQAAFRPKG